VAPSDAAHRRLDQPVTVWRIGDPNGRFPVWSPVGTRLRPGRWNAVGDDVIYAASSYPLALLEKLVHWSGVLPAGQHYVEAVLPSGTSYEEFAPDLHPGWNLPDSIVAREFGKTWLREMRSAVLFAPSAVAPLSQNVLINPAHLDAVKIVPGREKPVPWDVRLFRG
jgi:RES domain-containing protein